MLCTVRNVDLCAVGIEYPLSSGPATFTPEDLIQAVASQDDPAIQAPRVWLGHPDDQRFHAGRTTPAGSAEPALGKVINMRVEDQGMTLVGDVVGCPTWLGNILASAYPSRSIEGFQEAETVTGHKWGLVITDLALLGVTWPGVSTLDDLEALYSEDGPEGIEVKEEDVTVAASRAVTAQVNIDDIRRAFYAELGSMDISQWSWIRAMQLDPNELIVDDDEGELYRIGFSVEGETVTFEAPEQVKIQYVNASQQRDSSVRALAASLLTTGEVAKSWDTPVASRPVTANQEASMTPEQLRASIGLPADATDDQVRSRLAELNAAAPDDVVASTPRGNPGDKDYVAPNPSAPAVQLPTEPYSPPGTRVSDSDPGAPPASPDQIPQQPDPLNPNAGPVAGSMLPPGMVAVPAEQWAGMQASVQALSARHATDQAQDDLRLVGEALRAGKFAPHQRQYFEARIKDPQTRDTFHHLLTAPVEQGGLAPGLIPVTAMGIDPQIVAGGGESDAYPSHWLPEVAAQKADSPIVMES
jgi:hypothetical protein